MHKHLNREDRIALGALRRAGLNQSQIAKELGFHCSTISRELKRNPKPLGGYHALTADIKARHRRRNSKATQRKIDHILGGHIAQKLNPLVSPETVAHELGLHHQTIYSWVYRDRPDLLNKRTQTTALWLKTS